LFFQPGVCNDLYCKMRDGPEDRFVKGRQYLERIWHEGAQYVDPDSAEKATRELASVFWELQLAYAVKCAGKRLVRRDLMRYVKNEGPDLFADEPAVWLEAVVVRCGTGPDALQYPEMGKVYNYSPDGVVLRLRSVIKDKSEQLKRHVDNGIIKPGQATVIAISGVTLPHRWSGANPPEIVRAVYPASNLVIEIDRATNASRGHYVEYRDRVKKKHGAEISTDVFLGNELAHVSAVLYGEDDWVNPSSPPGSDFKIVHNFAAETPLPDGWFPAGDEYWWRDGARIQSIRHA
jgi:hypothetical protein